MGRLLGAAAITSLAMMLFYGVYRASRQKNNFGFLLVRAIFKSFCVRKLIGKLDVPDNLRFGVQGSPLPLVHDADLSLPTADSNAFPTIKTIPPASGYCRAIDCRHFQAQFSIPHLATKKPVWAVLSCRRLALEPNPVYTIRLLHWWKYSQRTICNFCVTHSCRRLPRVSFIG